jgi:hypothetical protein
MLDWFTLTLGGSAVIYVAANAVIVTILSRALCKSHHALPKAVVTPLSEAELEPAFKGRYDAFERALTPFGATPVFRARVQNQPQGGFVTGLMRDPELQAFAALSDMPAPKNETLTLMEWTTALADGRIVVTTNASAISLFDRAPEQHVLQLRDVKDPVALRAVHAERLRQLVRDGATVAPLAEDVEAWFQASLDSFLKAQEARGIFRVDPVDGLYKFTWPGAVRVACRVHPNWKPRREAAQFRAFEAAWRDLDANRA